jgi:chemotaxis protein histidine kinase CheA
MINMKCPICGKDLDLQNKQIGTSENGDPIFNEYAICHSCKKQWNLDKQRAKKIAAKKAAEEKAKAEAAARAAEEKAKAEAAARAAEEKAKAEAAARAAEEKAKADAAARAAEEKRAARREAKARARKEAIARLAADKGISEEEAERILKERARARKAAAQKAATDATATDNSEEQKYGNIPAEEIRDKREKAVRKGYEDMLATDPDSKAAKKKKKEEAETAKAKEDVKSRKMDDYDDEDDDEYEYVDEYPRFRPGRIILGIISLLAFGFCIYKGFVTGLSTSGADVTSAPGMNYVIVALCMLVTALLYFIMNNRDTLFAFLIPMIVYIGSAVFAFLKHGDEFELLILAGVSGVLAVISLILAIASRGGDDYDDEDDYDDPFEEEHDN